MATHKKLFIVGWGLIASSIGLMVADKYLLSCIVVSGPPTTLSHIDQWLDSSPVLIVLGVLVLLVTFIFWRIKQNISILAFMRDVVLIALLLLFIGSIFIASLNSARDKGTNAAMKANISNLRSNAEIYYDQHQSYKGFCGTNELDATRQNVYDAKTRIDQGLYCPEISVTKDVICNDSQDSYAVSTMLVERPQTGKYFCVDSAGSQVIVENPVMGTICK